MMSAPIMKQAADSPLVHRLITILVVKNMDPNQGSEQHFYLLVHHFEHRFNSFMGNSNIALQVLY